jgi:hypothetical protein
MRDLERSVQVSTDTVSRHERGEELKARTFDAIRRALKDAGAEFVAGEGVRRHPARLVASGTEPPLGMESDEPVSHPRKSVMKTALARDKSRLGQLRASRGQSMMPVSHVR